MDIEQAHTFLAIVSNGSFLEAAERLHVTQSTVSARIRNLEDELGNTLFIRNRSGAKLTTAGHRFLPHAKSLILTMSQARHDVGLSDRFKGSIRIGGRIALWEDFLPRWVGWMRNTEPDISINSDIGFEDDLMRRLIEGSIDIAVMYTPSHAPDVIVEHLFDETLVFVSSSPETKWPDDTYIHVNWGPGFYKNYHEHFPDTENPAQYVNIGWLGIQLIMANGGSCYLPIRMAREYIKQGKLFIVEGSPEFKHPAYMVFSRKTESEVLLSALEGMRTIAAQEIAMTL
jgi:DNA-binding transcriptional LysR family regulator